MKLKIVYFLFFYVFLTCHSPSSLSDEIKITALYFSSDNCGECVYVKNEIFPPVLKKYGGFLTIKEMNINEDPENLELALDLVLKERKFGSISPSVVIGKTVLSGPSEIKLGLEKAVLSALEFPNTSTKTELSRKGLTPREKPSLPLILAGGLIDGVNLCAFAAIALLISMMHVRSYGAREIAAVTVSYCLAVFIAYTLIGFGAFGFIYSFRSFYVISRVFRSAVGALCFILAAGSLLDFSRYKKTGKADSLMLSLPAAIKKKISLTLGSSTREENRRDLRTLFTGVFLAGSAVSVLEMVCTGQVYLPILVYMTKTSGISLGVVSLILAYNLMFIMPLIAVSVLYTAGVRSVSFGSFIKRHAGDIKLFLAALFIFLGVAILFF